MFRSPVTPGGKRITRKDTARTQFCCCLFAFFALTPCGRKRCMIRTLLKRACSRGGRKSTRPAAPKIDTWHARKRFGQKNLRDSAKRLVWGTLTSLTRATPPLFSRRSFRLREFLTDLFNVRFWFSKQPVLFGFFLVLRPGYVGA